LHGNLCTRIGMLLVYPVRRKALRQRGWVWAGGGGGGVDNNDHNNVNNNDKNDDGGAGDGGDGMGLGGWSR
jgi:hypothetical protein